MFKDRSGGMEDLLKDWTATATVTRETRSRVLGMSSGRKRETEYEVWCAC